MEEFTAEFTKSAEKKRLMPFEYTTFAHFFCALRVLCDEPVLTYG